MLVGSTSSYYAGFTLALLPFATALAGVRSRSVRRLLPGLLATVLIAGTVVVNAAPSVVYRHQHGPNLALAGGRDAPATEILSMKVTNLVLPSPQHRLRPLARLAQRYEDTFPIKAEPAQALGAIGAAGLLWLLFVALEQLVRGRLGFVDERQRHLSLLTVVAILLATVGGLSSLLALAGFTQLRDWNRMSIVIAFFALAGLAMLAEQLRRRLARRSWDKPAFAALVALVLAVGLADQSSPAFVPDYRTNAAQFHSDGTFVAGIERLLPAGAMVFQLPYVPFPETPSPVRMFEYDPMRGYLHSHHLRWSYGGFKGRPEADWQDQVVREPPATMLRVLAAVGFQGVYVDRFGYTDGGEQVEAELASMLGPPAVVSPDGRLSFFSMVSLRDRLRADRGRDVLAAAAGAVLHPVTADYGDGFFGVEHAGADTWAWAPNSARLTLENPGRATSEVTLRFELLTAGPATVTFTLPDGSSQTVLVPGGRRRPARLDVRVPPGRSAVELRTDAPLVQSDVDHRDLHLQVVNLVAEQDAVTRLAAAGPQQ